MAIKFHAAVFTLTLSLINCANNTPSTSLEEAINMAEARGLNTALTRRKRYLTFPDGSSLQLVFCNQWSALIPIGDIFLLADTISLAWELPKDPSLFHFSKGYKDFAEKRVDEKLIHYIDESGKLLFKVPYIRKVIVNPAFAKRSVDNVINPKPFNREDMHKEQKNQDFLQKYHQNPATVEFHRTSRIDLYKKLEVFLKSLGLNGRQCILKTLCVVAQKSVDHSQQGNFVQELTKAVFTFPMNKHHQKLDANEYDAAHHHGKDCDTLYPECTGVFEDFI